MIYCFIIQVVALAFRDDAFVNEKLTLEIFLKEEDIEASNSFWVQMEIGNVEYTVLRGMTKDEAGFDGIDKKAADDL
ncbi:hypothetical protein EMPG_14511 [Blastomyces silverae]|uniref:Uncharacterized protein n=1 Tax=Blastomyces silverae TaxID=2060906 RepID=A0A0H1BG39_9EURO|nr:hypothetical protein EMPG_14511 [Blastomyces silverae]